MHLAFKLPNREKQALHAWSDMLPCCWLQGKVETVVRISGTSSGAAEPPAVISSPNSTNSSSVEGPQVATGTTGAMAEAVAAAAEKPQKIELGVDRIIDSKDNEFVLSAPKDNVATLTLDPQLIQDLTFLFASAAVSSGHASQWPC